MRWEIIPLVALSISLIVSLRYRTELLNVLGLVHKMEAFSDKEERFVARKLSGFIQQRYEVNGTRLREGLIENRIVESLYGEILRECQESGLIQQAVKGAAVVYYSEVSSGQNYYQLYILPNGTLVMSESLLEALLSTCGLEALAFAILHEVAHLSKKHTRQNLRETHRLGDLRRQLFLFENQYIGFDALFEDYYTNTRFTLDQELEADLFALRVMQGMGLRFEGEEDYRKVLRVMERGEGEEKERVKNQDGMREKAWNQYIEQGIRVNPTMKVVQIKPEILDLKNALQLKISQMRKALKESEAKEKEEKKRTKKARDYEIFDQMPYKYNTQAFTLKERHPISRARFEAATTYIKQTQKSEPSPLLDLAKNLWEDKRTKRLWYIPTSL
ncbi:hypothetical protein FGO68_gene8956 [Halteria grandinella]|uniref:Peptidase M48 domain-containing protein n=1 Tax=Halteria grandinella TaxID=5974 RepID=A0A8J8NDH0_HALGN|nr:hypothetical protein FGO68_gene8956 [Halteria grandinella]